MNIGDKVRLIHSKGEGIITKILKNDLVEVETEDGFSSPYLRKQLALVSRVESKYFVAEQNETETPIIENQIKAKVGIYLSFVPLNQQRYQLYLINNTDYNLPFCLSVLKENNTEGVGAGYIESKKTFELKEFDVQNFDSWGTFQFDCFYYRENRLAEIIPFTKKIKFRANTFLLNLENTPIINQKGYVFQIDKTDVSHVNTEELRLKMMSGTSLPVAPISKKPTTIIDLHIEELEKNSLDFNHSKPILAIQLDEFEKNLELAIAHGMDEITFIHGIGNGVLRDEIHRRLGRHKNVSFFKDAQKDKFGYGATLAKIK